MDKFFQYMEIFESKDFNSKIEMYQNYCNQQSYRGIEGVKDAMLISILKDLSKGQINYKENV